MILRNGCAKCDKIIINNNKYVNGGTQLFIKMRDNHVYEFSVCVDCLGAMTDDDMRFILERQKKNWKKELDSILKMAITISNSLELEAKEWSNENGF